MKRDAFTAMTYVGMIVGIFVDRFLIGASWPAFVFVVVGLVTVGALHVLREQSRRHIAQDANMDALEQRVRTAREKHQTHWPL